MALLLSEESLSFVGIPPMTRLLMESSSVYQFYTRIGVEGQASSCKVIVIPGTTYFECDISNCRRTCFDQ